MQIFSKKCFFSFIFRSILIWFALYHRANFGTLYLYAEFWNFSPLIKIISNVLTLFLYEVWSLIRKQELLWIIWFVIHLHVAGAGQHFALERILQLYVNTRCKVAEGSQCFVFSSTLCMLFYCFGYKEYSICHKRFLLTNSSSSKNSVLLLFSLKGSSISSNSPSQIVWDVTFYGRYFAMSFGYNSCE